MGSTHKGSAATPTLNIEASATPAVLPATSTPAEIAALAAATPTLPCSCRPECAAPFIPDSELPPPPPPPPPGAGGPPATPPISSHDTFLVKVDPQAVPDWLHLLRAGEESIVISAELLDPYKPGDLYVVRLKHPETDWRTLRKMPGVLRVEPNYTYRSYSPPPTPNDPRFSDQWNLTKLRVAEGWQLLGWPAEDLKKVSVNIALLDSGVAQGGLPDLDGQVHPTAKTNLVNITPAPEIDDSYGHGTAMASIITAIGNNKKDMAGLMWGTTIVPCKLANGDTADLAATVRCLRWVEQQPEGTITAVNYSFGASGKCSCILEDEIRNLRQHKILFVTASDEDSGATNDAVVGGVCPVYPAAHPVSNIIAVVDSRKDDSVSGRGGARSIHVAAPGGEKVRAIWGHNAGTTMIPGTSAATAHVTGLIALLKAQDHNRDWRALRNLVLSGGAPLPTSTQDKTISKRRIQAAGDINPTPTPSRGSMTCFHQLVRRRLLPVDNDLKTSAGAQIKLRALSINCDTPIPVPVKVVASSGSPPPDFSLLDDGVSPDESQGDGEFEGTWTVPSSAAHGDTFELHFWNDEEGPGEVLKIAVD